MSSGPIVFDAALLERFAVEILTRVSVPQPSAELVARRVVASDLAGHESHGLRRLVEYARRCQAGIVDPQGEPAVVVDGGSTVTVDGGRALGHVAVDFVTRLVIERARRHGVCVVALCRCDHVGRLADYCSDAAAAGVVMLCCANDAGGGQAVAPPGGVEARLSTNPIGIGVPRMHAPHLVLDMATSVVAKGRVSEWRDRGEPIPDEWVTAAGALRPVGGVKGFGLALAVEALAGALTGAGTVGDHPEHDEQGFLAIGIDIARFRAVDEFTAEVDRFVDYVKRPPLEACADPIVVPNEHGHAAASERLRSGVPVQRFTWDRLAELAGELGVAMPSPTTDNARARRQRTIS